MKECTEFIKWLVENYLEDNDAKDRYDGFIPRNPSITYDNFEIINIEQIDINKRDLTFIVECREKLYNKSDSFNIHYAIEFHIITSCKDNIDNHKYGKINHYVKIFTSNEFIESNERSINADLSYKHKLQHINIDKALDKWNHRNKESKSFNELMQNNTVICKAMEEALDNIYACESYPKSDGYSYDTFNDTYTGGYCEIFKLSIYPEEITNLKDYVDFDNKSITIPVEVLYSEYAYGSWTGFYTKTHSNLIVYFDDDGYVIKYYCDDMYEVCLDDLNIKCEKFNLNDFYKGE